MHHIWKLHTMFGKTWLRSVLSLGCFFVAAVYVLSERSGKFMTSDATLFEADATSFKADDSDSTADEDAGLFYSVDMEELKKQAINGSPMNYLPQYRNPCWVATASDDPSEKGPSWRLRCVPLVYQVGFSKCGTTDLFRVLHMHPDIISPTKEPLFWSFRRFSRRETFDTYLAKFDSCAKEIMQSGNIVNGVDNYSKIIIDASSVYAYNMDGWRVIPGHESLDEPKYTIDKSIRRLVPQARIIIIMRNPVDRTYSRFRMFRPHDSVKVFHDFVSAFMAELDDCLKYQTLRGCAYNYTFFTDHLQTGTERNSSFIRASLYYVYVRDWLEAFPRDQVYLVRGEDYYNNRSVILRDIFDFLDLDSNKMDADYWELMEFKGPANSAEKKGRSMDPMLDKTRKLLEHFFRPYNKMLAELVQDDKFLWNDV